MMSQQIYQTWPAEEMTPPVSEPAGEPGYRSPQRQVLPEGEIWTYGDPGGAGIGQEMGLAGQETAREEPPVEPAGGERGSPVSQGLRQSQRMKNPMDMASTSSPGSAEEACQASLRGLLFRNIGYFVVVTCLMGTRQAVTWQGLLHTVGSDYLVLYQPDFERYVSCDLSTVRFVQFHNVKGAPYCAAANNWQGRSGAW